MRPILFDEEARDELEAAVAYYEGKRAGLGGELREVVEKACALIQAQPQLSQQHDETEFRRRPLQRFPYTLFYLELADALWIAAVAHQSREPGYWKRRTPP